MSDAPPILHVQNLDISLYGDHSACTIVEGINIRIERGTCIALVGESGSGKTLTGASVMRLLPHPAVRQTAGKIIFNGQDISALSEEAMCEIRGKTLSYIPHSPSHALNPVLTVGHQLCESLAIHQSSSPKQAFEQALNLLSRLHVDDPERILASYPHQLSGGMRQRILIASALICEPDLIIADEPTTAMDDELQHAALRMLRPSGGTQHACLFITHNLELARQYSHYTYVIHAGRIVEAAPTAQIFKAPRHAYTRHLLGALITPNTTFRSRLLVMDGAPIPPRQYAVGCRFCQYLGRETAPIRPSLQETAPGHFTENCSHCLLP